MLRRLLRPPDLPTPSTPSTAPHTTLMQVRLVGWSGGWLVGLGVFGWRGCAEVVRLHSAMHYQPATTRAHLMPLLRHHTPATNFCTHATHTLHHTHTGSAASFRTAHSRMTSASNSSRLSAAHSAKEFPQAFVPTVEGPGSDSSGDVVKL